MKEKKMILRLYESYIAEDYKTSKRHKELSIKFNDKLEKFCENLKNKEKEEIDEILNLVFEMNGESEKQVFIDAYCIGTRLTTEALYEIKEK